MLSFILFETLFAFINTKANNPTTNKTKAKLIIVEAPDEELFLEVNFLIIFAKIKNTI